MLEERTVDARSAAFAERRAGMMDRIHAAGLEQFSRHGLQGTSTQDIAARAGISKQQLHYYIESKEALYESILRRTMQHWAHIGLNVDEDHSDPAVSLARLVQRKLDFTFEHPQVCRLFAGEILSGGHVIRRIWKDGQPSVDAAAALVQSWVDAGKIAPIDPMYLLFHIWALTQHYADYEAQVRFFARWPDAKPLDRDAIRAEITALVLRGVGLEHPPKKRRARAR
ncbi:TetR family transcriptional regulator [Ramlibacter sp. G-1-2-2]|uniref:TetR family transcriptional regulator n=1 Tax=Ramlibacter agri TaxID=2728837 RepID=A0A848H7L2_9BURK|nr:TetR family transcriptional regulator [Ramlibacter agri]